MGGKTQKKNFNGGKKTEKKIENRK